MLSLLRIFRLEYWCTLLRSNNFKRDKIVEDTIEDTSDDIVCEGTDPTLIIDVVTFYRHVLILQDNNIFAFHTIYLSFYVTSLCIIEMRQFS